jgi:hypothetical protein
MFMNLSMRKIVVKSACRWTMLVVAAALVLVAAYGFAQDGRQHQEILRYEVTWNGSKAGHGDITTKRGPRQTEVIAQAVSDGALKAVCEIWSRARATFTAKSYRPSAYRFTLKSNLLRQEMVDVKFDHKNKTVQINKILGGEREAHSERLGGAAVYDPITAAFLLRGQKNFNRPMFVDIFDGKDKARLLVTPRGTEQIKTRTGVHPAYRLNLKLVKIRGNEELATGQLWISNDRYRLPLLLTSSHVVGTVRFELVQAQL